MDFSSPAPVPTAMTQPFIVGRGFEWWPGFGGVVSRCEFNAEGLEGGVRGIDAAGGSGAAEIALAPELRQAARARRASFLAGRHAAAQALHCYRQPWTAIARGPDGAPCWPPGWVGSISHSAGVALCALAPSRDCEGVGIDIEQRIAEDALTDLLPLLLAPGEVLHAGRQGPGYGLGATLLFCAKEALFKALYPQVRRYFDFTDARVLGIDSDVAHAGASSGRLDLELLCSLSARHPAGRRYEASYRIRRNRVSVLLALPPPPLLH